MNDVALPNARMVVERRDGTVETDPDTDAYSLLIHRTVGSIKSIANLDKARVHTKHVLALIVSAPKAGSFDTTTTLAVPIDPELGGALAFAALMSLRKHNPGAFEVALRRLRDAGVAGTPPLVSP